MLYFKYIKHGPLKDKFSAKETNEKSDGHETSHLESIRFITNKGFHHDSSGQPRSRTHCPIQVNRRQRLPDYPSSFTNDPLSPSTWRAMSAEIGNRTIHVCAETRELIRSLIRKFANTGFETRLEEEHGSLEILCEPISPPDIADPFPLSSRLIFVPPFDQIFFSLFSPLLSTFSSLARAWARVARMRRFFFEIRVGRERRDKRWLQFVSLEGAVISS